FIDCKLFVIHFIAARFFPETLYYVLLFCDWDMWKESRICVQQMSSSSEALFYSFFTWSCIRGMIYLRAETAEGDEAVVSALAVGLTGWISRNLEEN
ncbi:unnamed protein product, partial [Bubo scandiacus]